MGGFYERITETQQAFIRQQHIFCVATAHSEGRINLSPKGLDTFRILDDHTVCYLDLSGSGHETAAHLQHDGRITFMFCSYGPKPNILRLYGHGDVVRPGAPEWDTLFSNFEELPGQRCIIRARITSTQDSCGFAVPRYELIEKRDTLTQYHAKRTPEERQAKIDAHTSSIDGLPIRH